ncbi:MAG: hypothetical protein R3C10_08005 [Pirellulales bacterium]|nr:hypothetical protein [Planctomycetales bacterium]
MNKAFVKETEDPGDRCPGCGGIGTSVYRTTIEAHLPAEDCERLADPAYFCPYPTCDVAYFDEFARTVPASRLRRPLYPKDAAAPICPCFGLTCDDIEADVAEGVVTRVKAHLTRAQSDEAHCETATADGRSCVAAVQRYFMRLRGS